jgi:regulator of RNase E activity RraA
MNVILTPEQMDILRRLDGCTIANAIETFHERLRNEGFADDSVRCLLPHLPPMLGYAATIKVRGSSPATAGPAYRESTEWWDFVLSQPAPRVVVVQDVSTRPGLGSLVGAVHMNILRVLGCAGVVTNGAVRNIPQAEAAGFHLFAGSVSVSHAYIHIVEFGTPVEIGGLKIRSGDLLHGDLHGVQSIPLDLASKLPRVAAEIISREQEIITLCQSQDVTVEKLRAAVSRLGL